MDVSMLHLKHAGALACVALMLVPVTAGAVAPSEDFMLGGASTDTLRARSGDDMLAGRGGTDALFGGSGHARQG